MSNFDSDDFSPESNRKVTTSGPHKMGKATRLLRLSGRAASAPCTSCVQHPGDDSDVVPVIRTSNLAEVGEELTDFHDLYDELIREYLSPIDSLLISTELLTASNLGPEKQLKSLQSSRRESRRSD